MSEPMSEERLDFINQYLEELKKINCANDVGQTPETAFLGEFLSEVRRLREENDEKDAEIARLKKELEENINAEKELRRLFLTYKTAYDKQADWILRAVEMLKILDAIFRRQGICWECGTQFKSRTLGEWDKEKHGENCDLGKLLAEAEGK